MSSSHYPDRELSSHSSMYYGSPESSSNEPPFLEKVAQSPPSQPSAKQSFEGQQNKYPNFSENNELLGASSNTRDLYKLQHDQPTDHDQQSRSQQVVSQQSVNTTSTNSPRRTRKDSGQSISSSEFSRSTSPLDYKPPINETHSRHTSIASLRHPSFSHVTSQSGRNSAASNTSLHCRQNGKDVSHAASDTNFISYPSSKADENERAQKTLTDLTERVSSPPLEFPSVSTEHVRKTDSNESLRSDNSELGELENFTPSQTTKEKPVDLFQDAMKTPAKHRIHLSDVMPGDETALGVRKENSIIDAQTKEIFNLKLKIMIQTDMLEKASPAGVNEIRKQLVDSEAARRVQNMEMEKMRRTMALLEQRNEERDLSNAKAIQLEFDEERAMFEQRESMLKVSFFTHFNGMTRLIFRINLRTRSKIYKPIETS